jgi:hypothetical protein
MHDGYVIKIDERQAEIFPMSEVLPGISLKATIGTLAINTCPGGLLSYRHLNDAEFALEAWITATTFEPLGWNFREGEDIDQADNMFKYGIYLMYLNSYSRRFGCIEENLVFPIETWLNRHPPAWDALSRAPCATRIVKDQAA